MTVLQRLGLAIALLIIFGVALPTESLEATRDLEVAVTTVAMAVGLALLILPPPAVLRGEDTR